MTIWNAQLTRARALHSQGQLHQAREIYEEVLRAQPGNLHVISTLAILAGQSQDFERAVRLFDRVLALDPHNAAAHCNRGLALHELGLWEAALSSFDRAIALKPDYAVAHYNRGNTLKRVGEARAALASYSLAITHQRDFSQAHYNRAVVLQELGDWDAALAAYEQTIALQANFADAHYNRAVVLQALGSWTAAVEGYDKVIALAPRFAAAYSNRGVVLNCLNQPAAALDSLNHAIAIAPDLASAHVNRGQVLCNLKRYADSLASFDRALALGSKATGLHGSRRHVKMQLCDWQEYAVEQRDLEERLARHEPAAPPFHALVTCHSAAVQRSAAESWIRQEHPAPAGVPALARYQRADKIKIGYFSADFHDHATLYLMARLFELHHLDSFEISIFSYGPDRRDGMRARLKAACSRFYELSGESDAAIARRARELQIDIAVDLKGLTQFSRPGIFARRAAPIQVSYLGYPGTMGADFMDYLIADRMLIPEGFECHYREKLIFMPHSYQVNDATRTIADVIFTREQLGLPQGGFVFCCFNNPFKITPQTYRLWMRILQRVTGSTLWLFEDNAVAVDNLRREAANHGVDPARLVFAPFMSLPLHLARHRAADLCLDTFPYNAHTTASDALWAGLPVLTKAGETFASRVAGSLLTAVGLPELITSSDDHYEQMAIELAADPQRLSGLKEKLRERRLNSPLFDTSLFCKHLESAYRLIYERHLAELPTAHIYVPP